jgi:formylglycine-generating enzyme required for sulfatase activity
MLNVSWLEAAEEPTVNEPEVAAKVHKLIMSKLDVLTEAQMKPYTNTIAGTRVTYAMLPIPGGEFLMGSPDAEPGRKADEGPQHRVKISPFWMGQFEVTWDEYELFMFPGGDKPGGASVGAQTYVSDTADAVARPTKPYVEMSFGMGKISVPAISMTQHAASKYCQWLSAKTGHFYRLPTEAEWEYACRAGTTTRYFWGDDEAKQNEYVRHGGNSSGGPHRVGELKPNAWGLYDICGNAYEYCTDWFSTNYYAVAPLTDPKGPATGDERVVRSGSWGTDPMHCRSAFRGGAGLTHRNMRDGFRVVREAE